MNALILPYNQEKVIKCLERLKTLNHDKRKKILSLIFSGEAVTVTSIYKHMKIT